jgi:integrase
MSKSTTRRPQKPYPSFPLTIHPSGRYCKKIAGKTHYFGSWADGPEAALERYRKEKDDLASGIDPRAPKPQYYTLQALANDFLNMKRNKVDDGELSLRHFGDLIRVCKRLVGYFGKTKAVESFGPDQFEQYRFSFPKTWGVHKRKKEIACVRALFNYADAKDKITKLKFGPGFDPPDKKAMNLEKQNKERVHGGRLFKRDELHQVLDNADPLMRALVLVAINAGFGNTDLATITLQYIDLDNGWHHYPRPKTTCARRARLWPETIQAIREWLKVRPRPARPEYANLLFLSRRGQELVSTKMVNDQVVTDDRISKRFKRLLRLLGIYRPGLSFYSLRHHTETEGGVDQVAINMVMGHVDSTMAGNYRHKVEDSRLQSVADSIHAWLFPAPALRVVTA